MRLKNFQFSQGFKLIEKKQNSSIWVRESWRHSHKNLRATICKNLIFNFHPEIDFADNSFATSFGK